ncbi:MAG: alpha/beta hydrolase [Salaquimonas sp.]
MADWENFNYTSTDGLRLAGRKYGWENRDAKAVVCLPGLSRNSADFHQLAMHLANDAPVKRRVLCLDYRGRGNSQYDKNWENYSILIEADDVVQGVTAAGLEHPAFVGTSRGGLILMILAAMKPTLLSAIVMNDVGPEIDGPGLVRIKKMLETSKNTVSNWQEARDNLQQMGKRSFPKFDDAEWDRQARLIYTEKDGKIVRNYDPKLTNTLKAIDLDVRLPELWPQFTGLRNIPLMLIRGELTDLLAEKTVAKMQVIHPDMAVINVPDQGHAPDIGSAGLPEKISAFLEKNDH